MRTLLPGFSTVSGAVTGGAPRVTPDLWATHPTVAAQPHDGHRIASVFPYGGDLLLGYGDWTNNTGPVDLLGVDLTTAAPVTLFEGVRSEAIEAFRVVGGNLYVPWIDPIAGTAAGGYLTDAGGTWHEVTTPDMVHCFDMATTDGTDLIVSGSSTTGGLIRSTDAGATWTNIVPAPTTARIHTVIGTPLGVYLPTWGKHWTAAGGWIDWPIWSVTARVSAARPTLGAEVYHDGLALDVTTGAVRRILPHYRVQAAADGLLYGARWYDGDLVVAALDGALWRPVLRLDATDLAPPWARDPFASSVGPGIAVVGGHVYVGGSHGRVYRTPLP